MTEILQMPKMFVKGKNIWTLPVSTSKKCLDTTLGYAYKNCKNCRVKNTPNNWIFL